MSSHPIIFNGQDLWRLALLPHKLRHVRARFLSGFSDAQTEIKATPMAGFALQAQAASLQFHKALGDCQAQASAFRAFAGLPQTVKGLEDALLLFRRNSRSVIAHFHLNFPACLVSR